MTSTASRRHRRLSLLGLALLGAARTQAEAEIPASPAVPGTELVEALSPVRETATPTAPPTLRQETRARPAAFHWLWPGPLVEIWKPEGNSLEAVGFSACRPFFSVYREDAYRRGADIFWPLGGHRVTPQHDERWIFPLYHNRWLEDGQLIRWRTSIFPIATTGTRPDRSRYAALFPVGGTVHALGPYEEVAFVLFPVWMRSEQRTLKESAITTDVLWPIYSRTESQTRPRWRVFPFYGWSKTPVLKSQFCLWPLYTWADGRYVRTEGAPVASHSWFLFPLIGHVELSREPENAPPVSMGGGWTWLWPFFVSERVNWEDGQAHKLHAPWPFFVYRENTRPRHLNWEMRLWPIWGCQIETMAGGPLKAATSESSSATRPPLETKDLFVLWPLYKRFIAEEEHGFTSRTRVALAWQTHVREQDRVTVLRDNRLWPLFSLQQDTPGQKGLEGYDLRLPDLWPFAHPPATIRRNFQPLWTLYQQSGGPEGEFQQQLLWGLWEWRQVPQQHYRKISFPLLFSYEHDPEMLDYSLLGGIWKESTTTQTKTRRLLWFFKWNAGDTEPQ